MKRVRLGLRIFVLLSCVGLAAIAFLVWGAGGHRRDERTFRAEELAVYHSLLSDWIQSGYRQINLVSIPMSLNVADCQSGRRSGEARRGRHRVALALMGDAGYDPWQAPEAWRLVDAEKLPSDLATLDYTDADASELRPRAGGIHWPMCQYHIEPFGEGGSVRAGSQSPLHGGDGGWRAIDSSGRALRTEESW